MSIAMDYKVLVEKYMEGRKINWELYADKAERGYTGGDVTEDGDYVVIHMEEFIDGHHGQYVMDEFCKWFGISYGREEHDIEVVVTDFDTLRDEFTTWLDAHKPSSMEGHFEIGFNDSDGSLDLSFIADKQTLSFSQWRRDEGYCSWDRMYNDGLCAGKEYDELSEEWDAMKDEFTEYCEQNNYIADMDED